MGQNVVSDSVRMVSSVRISGGRGRGESVGQLGGDFAVEPHHEIEKRDAQRLAPLAGGDEIEPTRASLERGYHLCGDAQTVGEFLGRNEPVGAGFDQQIEEDALCGRGLEAAHWAPPRERGALGAGFGLKVGWLDIFSSW